MKIYLASKSPRRRELLMQMGVYLRSQYIDIYNDLSSLEPVQNLYL